MPAAAHGLGHLGLNVADLAAAKVYYDEFMPLVSYRPFVGDEASFSYEPLTGVGTRIFFYPALNPGAYSSHAPGLGHLAFAMRSRFAVRRAYDWASQRGDQVLHAPREFPEYHPGYYAAFWTDSQGFPLEVVCHHDEGALPT